MKGGDVSVKARVLNILLTLLFLITIGSFVGTSDSHAQSARGMFHGVLMTASAADTTAPTLSSATIGTNGTTLTLGMSETVTRSGGVFDVDCNTAGSNITATYSSGSGSSTLVYTLGSTVGSGDTCNLDYNGASNGIEDAAGNDLASITDRNVTNNSTQTVGADSQITFYFNCDSNTNDQSPQKGSGTISYTSDFTVVSGAVSNALSSTASMSAYEWNFPVSGNMNLSVGTLGFFWRASTITAGATIVDGDATGFYLLPDSATSMKWKYATGDGQTFTIAADTTYYIEVAWDIANTRQSYRVNGGSWVEYATVSGSAPSFTALNFGSSGGGSSACWWDQIMISSVYQKDLYSVRNSTNP
jgi:hypothetical protein